MRPPPDYLFNLVVLAHVTAAFVAGWLMRWLYDRSQREDDDAHP